MHISSGSCTSAAVAFTTAASSGVSLTDVKDSCVGAWVMGSAQGGGPVSSGTGTGEVAVVQRAAIMLPEAEISGSPSSFMSARTTFLDSKGQSIARDVDFGGCGGFGAGSGFAGSRGLRIRVPPTEQDVRVRIAAGADGNSSGGIGSDSASLEWDDSLPTSPFAAVASRPSSDHSMTSLVAENDSEGKAVAAAGGTVTARSRAGLLRRGGHLVEDDTDKAAENCEAYDDFAEVVEGKYDGGYPGDEEYGVEVEKGDKEAHDEGLGEWLEGARWHEVSARPFRDPVSRRRCILLMQVRGSDFSFGFIWVLDIFLHCIGIKGGAHVGGFEGAMQRGLRGTEVIYQYHRQYHWFITIATDSHPPAEA